MRPAIPAIKGRSPVLSDQWRSPAHLFGAVCPARGGAAGLVLPVVSTAAMNAHLAEISRRVASGAPAVLRRENDPPDHFLILLIPDGAGWHGAKALVLPDNLSLLTLPPCSPAARNLASLKTVSQTVFLERFAFYLTHDKSEFARFLGRMLIQDQRKPL